MAVSLAVLSPGSQAYSLFAATFSRGRKAAASTVTASGSANQALTSLSRHLEGLTPLLSPAKARIAADESGSIDPIAAYLQSAAAAVNTPEEQDALSLVVAAVTSPSLRRLLLQEARPRPVGGASDSPLPESVKPTAELAAFMKSVDALPGSRRLDFIPDLETVRRSLGGGDELVIRDRAARSASLIFDGHSPTVHSRAMAYIAAANLPFELRFGMEPDLVPGSDFADYLSPLQVQKGAPIGRRLVIPAQGLEVVSNIGLSHRAKSWGPERMALDGVSNHLPADSGGKSARVRLKQRDAEGEIRWIDLSDADPAAETLEIVFEDDGRGYDAKNLLLLFSDKDSEKYSVGQFGEGLKLISAAALRHGAHIEFRSQDWSAEPYIASRNVEGELKNRLGFRFRETAAPIAGSRTVMRDPPAELLAAVFSLPQTVLYFNDQYREVETTKLTELLIIRLGAIRSAIVRIWGALEVFVLSFRRTRLSRALARILLWIGEWIGPASTRTVRILDRGEEIRALFVKGVRIHDTDAVFDYDIDLREVSPDREYADYESNLTELVRVALLETRSVEVAKRIIKYSQENPESASLEHTALSCFEDSSSAYNFFRLQIPRPFQDNVWRQAFLELYGPDATLVDPVNDGNNEDAEAFGFPVIRVNPGLHAMLTSRRFAVPSLDKATGGNRNYHWIEEDDLKEDEKAGLTKARAVVSDLVALQAPKQPGLARQELPVVNIYSHVTSDSGRTITGNPGVMAKSIGLQRDQLTASENELASTAIHEAGHYASGRNDHVIEFTQYFITMLSRLLLRQPAVREDVEQILSSPITGEMDAPACNGGACGALPADTFNIRERIRAYFPPMHIKLLEAMGELSTLPLTFFRDIYRDLPHLRRLFANRVLGPAWRRARAAALSGSETVVTMVTLAYRRKKWGLDRILLDVVSNHLPADSDGQSIRVRLKQNGEWVDLDEADRELTVEAVAIEDDGKGFDISKLEDLESDKSAQGRSVGQFGEGMKLAAAAAMRNRIDIEFQSRDWSARPFSLRDHVDGRSVERLAYAIERGRAPVVGSRTLIHNPPADLVARVFSLPKNILQLGDPAVVYTAPAPPGDYASQVIDAGRFVSSLFVKGVKVRTTTALFDWDLGIDSVAPDRDLLPGRHVLKQAVFDVLAPSTDVELVAAVLQAGEEDSVWENVLEFNALGSWKFEEMRGSYAALAGQWRDNSKYKTWREVFHRLHEIDGRPAILADPESAKNNAEAEALGYHVVHLNKGLTQFLNSDFVYIPTARNVVFDTIIRRFTWVEPTELSVEERRRARLADRAFRYLIRRTFGNVEVADSLSLQLYGSTRDDSGKVMQPESLGYDDLKELRQRGIFPLGLVDLKSDQAALEAVVRNTMSLKTAGAKTVDRESVNYLTEALAQGLLGQWSEVESSP